MDVIKKRVLIIKEYFTIKTRGMCFLYSFFDAGYTNLFKGF